MKHKVIILALLLISFILNVGVLIPCETRLVKEYSEITSIYQGDLIISGNTNCTIIDQTFEINGSIFVEDNATLYLKNATIKFIQTDSYFHYMHFGKPLVETTPRLQAFNSTITSDSLVWINFLRDSSLVAFNLTVSNAWMDLGDRSIGTFSNCTIQQIYVSYSATILNSKIEIMQAHAYRELLILNSTVVELVIDADMINFSLSGLGPGRFSFWNFITNCSATLLESTGLAPNVTLIDTEIEGFRFSIYSSTAHITDSEIERVSVSEPAGWLHSYVSISNCTISSLTGSDSPQISVSNSTIGTLEAHLFSNCTIIGLTPGFIDSWNLLLNCSVIVVGYTPNFTLKDVQIGNWTFVLLSSNAIISKSLIKRLRCSESFTIVKDSKIEYLYPDYYSDVWLENSTYNECDLYSFSRSRVYFCWYLDVHVVDMESSDVYNANVTIIYSNGTMAESRIADEKGLVRFTLIEKMLNGSGSYPVGNYTVTATYENYSREQTVNMTGNKQITITLPFIIPEFPSASILPLLMILTLVAVVFRKTISTKRVNAFQKSKNTSNLTMVE